MPIVKCDYCGEEFKKLKSEIKRSKHNFCSPICNYKFKKIKNQNKRIKCEICGVAFYKKPHKIKATKHNFCSPKCTGIHKNKKETLKCQYCEEKFTVSPSLKNRKYCSSECYFLYRKEKRIMTNCEYCRKEIKISPYDKKTFKKHFCDNQCMNQYKKDNIPTTQCIICGTHIQRNRMSSVNFCSLKCYGKYLYKQVTVKCNYCGEEFKKKTGKINKSKTYFCSQKCYWLFQGKSRKIAHKSKISLSESMRNRAMVSNFIFLFYFL